MTRDQLKTRTQQAIDAIRVFKEKDYGWSQMEKMLYEILLELDDSDWHTGTPTEEGWYLLAYKHLDGYRYTTDYFVRGYWTFMPIAVFDDMVGWQKIELYKEIGE